jgi:hypothetical protein
MAIRLLRLKSGEDIVADIDERDDTVAMENPAVLVPMGDPSGRNMQMGFGPWIPYVDGRKVEVEIPRDHVVFIVTPGKDIVNNYRQAFGSGIVVPEVKVDTKKVLTE